MLVEMHKIPVSIALEYAFAAQRINNGYVTETNFESKIYSNKDLVSKAIRKHVDTYHDQIIAVDLEVTDDDRSNAAEVDEHFKKYMFKSIAGKLNQFENDVYTLICSQEMVLNKAGLIAYVPELISRDLEKWRFEKMLKSEYSNSQASHDETVKGNMTILNVRTIRKDFESFTVVLAGMNGNLYQFYKKDMSKDATGKKYNINGRVKKSSIEYNTKIPLTVINYVKVAPCRNQ
jgi:hypothetical protein